MTAIVNESYLKLGSEVLCWNARLENSDYRFLMDTLECAVQHAIQLATSHYHDSGMCELYLEYAINLLVRLIIFIFEERD